MDRLEELTGFRHRVTSAYHPQANGLDERLNQTLVKGEICIGEHARRTSQEDVQLPPTEVVAGAKQEVWNFDS